MSYISNINETAFKNENFREVLFTGEKTQLVVMSIPVNGEVGEETHKYVEQVLYFLSGTCKVILNDEESVVSGGDIAVVTPNTKHNFINVGDDVVKIVTVYSPSNHIDGRIHKTIADAISDVEDEEFGERER